MSQKTDSALLIDVASYFNTGTNVWTGLELQAALNNVIDSKHSGFTKSVGIAYVESNGDNSTAEVGNPYRPYLTIDAALDATSALGYRIINIGIGTFSSPDRDKIITGTWFKGSGKPAVNNSVTPTTYSLLTITAPTALTGGTILTNTFWLPYDKHSLVVTDLGVDCGSTWCNASNGGTAADALVIPANTGLGNFTQNGRALRKNIVVKNVTTLAKGPTDLIHSCLLENCFEPYVENVETWNGFAGFVSKNVGGIFTGIKAHNSNDYNIIIKCNTYAYSISTTLSNFEIYGGAGLALHNEDGDNSLGMIGITVNNGQITGTTYGVKQLGNQLEGINIGNVTVKTCSGNGFEFSDLRNSKIHDCIVYTATGKGFLADGENYRIHNCGAYNITGNGFEVQGGSSSLRALVTDNDCPSDTFVATGSFVYGADNFYNSLTGTINAI